MTRGEKVRTSVGLNAGCDLSCADVVKIGDVLTKDGAEITFTKTFCVDLAGVDPDNHVGVGAEEHAET